MAAGAVAQAKQRVTDERDAVATWTTAMQATFGQRCQLDGAIHDTTAALDHTRPERVAAAALDPTTELRGILGAPPPSRGGMAAWCGIAERLEAINDCEPADHSYQTHGQPSAFYRPQERQTTTLLANAADIIATANQLDPEAADDPLVLRAAWQPTVETADRTLAAHRSPPALDRGLGLEL